MFNRIMHRGKTSGRADDNPDTIRSRLNTFENVIFRIFSIYSLWKILRDHALGSPYVRGLDLRQLKSDKALIK